MKKILFAAFLVLLLQLPSVGMSQAILYDAGGEEHIFDYPANDALHPCISALEYQTIEQRCAENRLRYGIPEGPISGSKVSSVALEWPLKAAPTLHDCSFYRVSAYVDEDTLPGSVKDWNCGSNTYDGHRGTDIATFPFNFYKMDNDLVEVVAAAPGTIIDKHDGEFDRNCSGNNLTANYVIVQHADGSMALYWHMKNGSITTTGIGQTVALGDHIGVVGSSGSSSGPHLHFEVWSGSTSATRKDPFGGSCNLLNGNTSWWANQKPAKETAIIRASTHTTDIVLPPCPATETLNESTSFTIPFQGAGLPPGYAKFYIFIRDEVNGLTADLSIIDPNGATYLAWTYTSTSDAGSKTWGWSKVLPTISGTYTFRAVYNGVTCESTFDIIGVVGAAESPSAAIKLYPNPSDGRFTLDLGSVQADAIQVFDLLGKTVHQSLLAGPKSEFQLNAPDGVYLYKLLQAGQVVNHGRLVVE